MTECTICHDSITDATGYTKLSCNHTYHLRCIVKWLFINELCPCCRKGLTEYESVKYTHSIDNFEITGYDTTEHDHLEEYIIR